MEGKSIYLTQKKPLENYALKRKQMLIFFFCLSVLFDFSIICEWKGIRATQEELFTTSAFFPDSWGLCGLSHGYDGYNLSSQFFPFGDQPKMGGAGTDLLPTL